MCEVTILMPCLDEAETLQSCIEEAAIAAREAQLSFEILIADNGSTDGSQKIALNAGARVVNITERGYGAALAGGIAASNGEFVVFGDCDRSYDFGDVPRFVTELRADADLVMGNRFQGGIEPGAMPWLHRWLGNPVLSWIGRLFFSTSIGDFHCGLRGLRRSAFAEIPLVTRGMEFASELVIKAALHDLRIREIPTVLRPDGRSRPPHLNTWRDGWRHLRFMLLFAPEWVFFGPAVAVLIIALLISIRLAGGSVSTGNIRLDLHTMLVAAAAIIAAVQLALFAIFGRCLATMLGVLPVNDRLESARRWLSLEKGLMAAFLLVTVGSFWVLMLVDRWRGTGFGDLNAEVTLRQLMPAVTLVIAGLQLGFGSFFLGLLSLMPHQRPTPRP